MVASGLLWFLPSSGGFIPSQALTIGQQRWLPEVHADVVLRTHIDEKLLLGFTDSSVKNALGCK